MTYPLRNFHVLLLSYLTLKYVALTDMIANSSVGRASLVYDQKGVWSSRDHCKVNLNTLGWVKWGRGGGEDLN